MPDLGVTWYGTAGLLLQFGDAAIAFDPFAGLPLSREEARRRREALKPFYAKASHVFLTHGHVDHIADVPFFYGDSSARIYGTSLPCRTLADGGFPNDRLRIIAPGWQGRAGPFLVGAWKGKHCEFDTPLILRTVFSGRVWRHLPRALSLLRSTRRYPEGGETLLYQVTAGGLRIQVMGSMALDPDTEYPAGADALFLPYQGRSDPLKPALDIVKRLRPRAVYPVHWDDSMPPLTQTVDTAEFQRQVGIRFGIPCRDPEPGRTIEIGSR